MRVSVMLAAFAMLSSVVVAEDFKPLFDGKTLKGWTGDEELWSVEDGVIVGTTDNKKITKNSFLAYEKKFANFSLRLKFKLRNGNSGVQFRSTLSDNFRVSGYQADIADNKFLGILYSEGTGRGILQQVKDVKALQEKINKDGWNEYEITANGNKITQAINGIVTVDFTDEDEKKAVSEGIIALQAHVGPKMRIEFKDIEIKELP
ncbi:MAG: DUF1080 domain-containing protein [Planctomycetales bacterium]